MGGAELDTELTTATVEGAEESGTDGAESGDGGRGVLTGGFPPDEPGGGGGGGGGGSGGGGGGTLTGQGLTDPLSGSPVRGNIPFMNLEFDPIIYQFTVIDSKSRQHHKEYLGLSRSECVVHYLTRLAFDDFERRVGSGDTSGFSNMLAERLLRVIRTVHSTARDEVRAAVLGDTISTLVQRGIASQEHLEEVLGVPSHGIA